MLGLGNLLFSDEGFGIQAVEYLHAGLGDQYPVEWVDGGVLGLDLLPLVEDSSHLLLLDAIDAGEPGGTVLQLIGDQIPLYAGMKMSEHQVGFQEVLALARLRGYFPPYLQLVGVQPASLNTGTELSAEVKAALPKVAQRAEGILKSWCDQQ